MLERKWIIVFSIYVYIFSFHLFGQHDVQFQRKNVGLSVGAHFALGSHFQRLGLSINAFYIKNHFQLNTETRVYFSAKNLGPKGFYTEALTAVGVLGAFGKRQTIYNPFLSSVSNQTGYIYGLAYSFNAYWNRIKTTQQTGTIAFHFDKVELITENDLLARPALDRFRTGALLLQYRHENILQVGLNCTMWTGKMGFANRNDKTYPAPGYMDTTGSVHPRYSHGLLSAQAKFNIGYGQNVQANIGVDAEQVRHVFQNKIIHDVCWLPKKWFERKNCHIPMLDVKGNQYLFKEGQKIKPEKFYWNIFSNAGLFY
jgi:hypothetical protein